jgi:hypothetical protein
LEPPGTDDTTDTTRKDFPKPFSPTSDDIFDPDGDDDSDERYEEFDRPTPVNINHQKFRKDFAVKDKLNNNRVEKKEKRKTQSFDDDDEFEKARRQGKVLRFVCSFFRSLLFVRLIFFVLFFRKSKRSWMNRDDA